MSKVTVYDLLDQRWVTVDADVARSGIEAGQYEPGQTTVNTAVGGTAQRSVADQATTDLTGETEATAVQSALASEAAHRATQDAYDTVGDKALTFAEGVVDAMSLGLIHQTGEEANIRREVNSGSALVGQLLGTAVGLGYGGPVRVVAKGGEAAGRAAARGLLSEAAQRGAAGKVVTRAMEEAAIGGGLMGATAFGHQVTDSIIEDKVFAGEVVLQEMGLGTALGFGAGALSGGFTAAASRSRIKAQGGLLDNASGQSRALVDEIKGVKAAWKDAAFQYEARAGVLEQLHKKGVIPDDMVAPYRDAAKRARRAVDVLDEYNPGAMLDAGPREFGRYNRALEEAHVAVNEGGLVFASPPVAARPQRLDVRQPGQPIGPVRTGHVTGGGEWSQHLDDLMLRDPEALAAYERLHGRPYEPMQRQPIVGEGGMGGERFVDDAAAPTDKTNPGGRRKQPAPEGQVNRVNGGVTGAAERRAAGISDDFDSAYESAPRSGEFTAVDPPGGPQARVDTRVVQQPKQGWTPKAPPGKFSLDDFSDDTLAGEGVGFRRLEPGRDDAPNLLNHDAGAREIGMFPDGHFAPSKDLDANARAFADFRERAASDTSVLAAQGKPADALSAQLQGPSTVRDWNIARGDGNKTLRDAAAPKGQPLDDLERTYKDPGVPRGEPLPKSPKAAVADEAVDDVTNVLEADGKTQVREPKKGSPEWDEFERRSAEDYVEKWYWESKAQGPRINPADEAAVRIDQAMRQLSELSGGRLDSAGALELGERLGLKGSSDMFVDRIQQVWALRKAAKFAADEARGVKGPLGRQGKGVVDEMAQRYMRKQAAVLGMVAAGPMGAAAGWVLGGRAHQMLGFGAKAASSSGRIMELALKTGDSLLAGRRATMAARAVASNRPYAYDDTGPISDPVERITKIQQVAANPDQVRATVRNQLGDVGVMTPALATAYEEAAVRQITNLAMAAPPISRDALGRPVMPTAGALRKFYEFENATHDLPGLLGSIQRGAVTPTQAMALAQQHIAVHGVIVKRLLSDPDVLARRTTAQLRAMEMILQIPLTTASTDPGSVMRTQASWAAGQQQQGPQQAPQAFKISAQPPTPGQAGPTAPGNQ